MLSKTSLVLGAGGPWGVAWMTGLILGLVAAGIDAQHPQAIIGSSAGAMLGAKLATGVSAQQLFEDQTSLESQTRQLSVFQRLTPPTPEGAVATAAPGQASMLSVLSRDWEDEGERIQAICDLALNANTVALDRFLSVMMPAPENAAAWPAIPLTLTAIDVDSRSLKAFDRHSGVDLSLAVLASCCIPGIWPPIAIDGHRYIDGGSWGSGDNAHLAAGAGSVLVISPLAAQRSHRIGGSAVLDRDIRDLRSAGARVHLIVADAASLAARGTGMPSPASMKAAAEAGRKQGSQAAAALRSALA